MMPGVYYPYAVVALYIRLDEVVDALPAEALAGLQGTPATGYWLPDGTMEEAPRDESLPRSLFVLTTPRSISIHRNPYNQADEARLTLRWADLPLDARSIRSLGVAVYMGTIDATRWDEQMRGGVSLSPGEKARTTAGVSLPEIAKPEHLRFIGFADSLMTEHSSGGDYVSATFRDPTGILLDTPVPTMLYRSVDWSRPIEEVVLAVLESLPATAGAVIHLIGFDPDQVHSYRGQAHRAGKAGKAPVRAPKVREETYWDLLTDLVVQTGLVLYFDVWSGPDPEGGVTRPTGRWVLARPASIYDDSPRAYVELKAARNAAGKLAVRAVGSGTEPAFSDRGRPDPATRQPMDVPTLVYGHDLASLSFERKFSKITVPSVVMRSVSGGRTRSARYPPDARAARVDPKGLHATDEPRVYTVDGVDSEADLAALAMQVFADLGRGEMTAKCETVDLATFGGGNADPDLLELRPGSPVRILVSQEKAGDVIGSVPALEAMGQGPLAAFLRARGLTEDQARGVAAALQSPTMRDVLSQSWYVREVEHSMDPERGYSGSITAVNYLQARIVKQLKEAGG